MLLGYIQLWRTSSELHWLYLTDFSSVRRQSWCDVDSVLMQWGAFVQLLARRHNRNLQNSLKKNFMSSIKLSWFAIQQAFLQAGKVGHHLSIQ